MRVSRHAKSRFAQRTGQSGDVLARALRSTHLADGVYPLAGYGVKLLVRGGTVVTVLDSNMSVVYQGAMRR